MGEYKRFILERIAKVHAIIAGMQIIVDELLTRYELTGQGKLVLLIHGWGDDAHGLAGLQADIAKKYKVMSLDLPGFGGSQPPQEVWDLDNYAAFLKHALDKLELSQPYAIIGHSNGGAIAIRAVSLNILQPKRLVLLAAAGIRKGKSARRLLFKIVAKTGNAATVWMPKRYRSSMRRSLYGAAGSDMLMVPELEQTFKKSVRQDVQADAANVTVPTLLIFAEKDQAVPLDNGKKYHQLIEGSKLEVIADAGHFLHIEQPEKVSRLVQEFLL